MRTSPKVREVWQPKRIDGWQLLLLALVIGPITWLFLVVRSNPNESPLTSRKRHLRTLYKAINLYLNDFDQTFPHYANRPEDITPSFDPAKDWTAILKPYYATPSILRDPLDGSNPTKYLTTYALNVSAALGPRQDDIQTKNWILMGIRNNAKLPPTTAWIFDWTQWANKDPKERFKAAQNDLTFQGTASYFLTLDGGVIPWSFDRVWSKDKNQFDPHN